MTNQPRQRAIIFDFVGVLLFPRAEPAVDPQLEAITAQLGRVTNDTVFRTTVEQQYQLSDAAFLQLLRRIVARYEPFLPLWRQLPHLHHTFRLAVINNGTYLTIPLFQERLPPFDNFDAFVSSAREGIGKPDPAIYLRTAQRLGVHPNSCLFMDDSQRNTDGAQAVGMQTIHWPNAETGWQAFQRWLALDGRTGDAM
jgi:HAD superfamily hydrolase (TIGR01509 family)